VLGVSVALALPTLTQAQQRSEAPSRALASLTLAATDAATRAPDGAALFAQHCAACHEKPAPGAHIPSRESLASRSPINIVMTLKTGAMQPQAAGLSTAEDQAIASYLTADAAKRGSALRPNRCAAPARPVNVSNTGWNGWGADLANTRFQPHADLKASEVPKLRVKWAFAYPGLMAWGQPTIIDGKAFVASTTGQVYSLDASTGCTWWTFEAGAPVRTSLSLGTGSDGHAGIVYFGDTAANVYAVDADSGKEIWRVHVDDHPLARVTGAPILHGGRLLVPVSSFEEGAAAAPTYSCCSFRGSVVSVDALTGKLIWKRNTISREPKPYQRKGSAVGLSGPAGASVWNTPTVDTKRGVLYVGTGNNYTDVSVPTTDAVMAIGLDDGQIRWSQQLVANDNWASGCTFKGPCPQPSGNDSDFSASIILVTLPSGRNILVAGQKSGVVYGLDPDAQGKPLWHIKVGGGGVFGGVEWGIAAAGTTVFVPISDSLTNTSSAARPGLAAIDAATGKQLWWSPAPQPVCSWGKEDCRDALSQAPTAIPGVVFSGSQDGHLRAYDAANGKVVWDFDTGTRFPAVNADSASGGSLDAGGPVVVNGRVYVNSGYGQFLGHGGNVLLALSPDGK